MIPHPHHLTPHSDSGTDITRDPLTYNTMIPPADQTEQWRHGRGAKELHAGRRNDGHADTTGNLAKHVVTPHTSEKRYEAPNGSIYIDWEPPKLGLPHQRTEPRRDVDRSRPKPGWDRKQNRDKT